MIRDIIVGIIEKIHFRILDFKKKPYIIAKIIRRGRIISSKKLDYNAKNFTTNGRPYAIDLGDLKDGVRYLESGENHLVQYFYEGCLKPLEFKNPNVEVSLTAEESELFRGTGVMVELEKIATKPETTKMQTAISLATLLGITVLIIVVFSMII